MCWGVRYAQGLGVNKDYQRAYAWLSLANHVDDPRIREALERLGARLTSQQITKAKALADDLGQVDPQPA